MIFVIVVSEIDQLVHLNVWLKHTNYQVTDYAPLTRLSKQVSANVIRYVFYSTQSLGTVFVTPTSSHNQSSRRHCFMVSGTSNLVHLNKRVSRSPTLQVLGKRSTIQRITLRRRIECLSVEKGHRNVSPETRTPFLLRDHRERSLIRIE